MDIALVSFVQFGQVNLDGLEDIAFIIGFGIGSLIGAYISIVLLRRLRSQHTCKKAPNPAYIPVSATLIGYARGQGSGRWIAVYEVRMANGDIKWAGLATDGYNHGYIATPIPIEQVERPPDYPANITWDDRK